VGDADVADPDPIPENDPTNDPAVGELVSEPYEPPATLEPASGDDQRRGADDEGRWKVRAQKGWVTVRNKVQQFYIGALYGSPDVDDRDWTIDVVFGDRGYLWGWGHGQYDYCGYINGNNVRNRVEYETDHCRRFDRISPSRIAGIMNCDTCNGGTGVELIKDVVAYRNVRPWAGANDHTRNNVAMRYKQGQRVAWRYVTKDRQWVAIVDGDIPSDSHWAFVPRDAFRYADDPSLNSMCRAQGFGTPQEAQEEGHSDFPAVCDQNGRP
jgi:hypothetical protein